MINRYGEKSMVAMLERADKTRYMLALGFFDCLHIGHRGLIANLCAVSELYNLKPAVFTFDDNFFKTLGKTDRLVYTLEERQNMFLDEFGIDKIFVGAPTKEFLQMTADQFLNYLENLSIGGIIAGEDFRFGVGAEAGMKELSNWAISKGILCITQPILSEWNKKISSRDIRRFLENGEVSTANSMLGRRYFLESEVVHGRGVGATYGLPTANLNISEDKVLPLDGVYDTRVRVGNRWFKGVTNVGTCPTFDFHRRTVETHILDFDEDIYGEIIRVEFVERIRCVVKFNSLDELKAQIYSDIAKVRESND
ncbi:MAG: bifunctional riboflavin kinase/FAD synthetase [Clostridia bacterium]|nr:bifunctional riboflavin kinase/FAD synthetase [Clostridia bacterium]